MNKQQQWELSMVASADPEHLEEVRGTIAAYLHAVKANDIATLRGLFDAVRTSCAAPTCSTSPAKTGGG